MLRHAATRLLSARAAAAALHPRAAAAAPCFVMQHRGPRKAQPPHPRPQQRGRTFSSQQQQASAATSLPNAASQQLLSPAIRAYPNTNVTTLDNGLRVATEYHAKPTTDMASVAVHLDAGSRYDHKAGVAHFLEHLFFKGTAHRTRERLEQEVENMGGQLNAYTSREQTVFHADVQAKDVPKMVEILADIIQNSTLDPQAIDAERSVIMTEMEEVDKNMDEVIFEKLHYTAYRGGQLSHTILGPAANVRSLSRADITQYLQSHYTAPRMVLVGAGNVQHDAIVELGQKHFGAVAQEPTNGIAPNKGDATFTGSDVRVREDSLPEAHIAYAFETCGHSDPDSVALGVMGILLGVGFDKSYVGARYSSSPLVSFVAGKDLANKLTSFNTQYSDTGLFGVLVSAEAVGQDALMGAVAKEVTRLCYEVSPERLYEAQVNMWCSLMETYESSSSVSEEVGRHLLNYGRRVHPMEMFHRIFDLKPSDIKRVANRFFYDRDHALAAVGPIHELPDYNALRNRSQFLRP